MPQSGASWSPPWVTWLTRVPSAFAVMTIGIGESGVPILLMTLYNPFSGGAGDFQFDRRFTSSNPNSNGTGGASPSGNALASLMLGYPTGDPGNLSRILVSSPADYFVNYYGASGAGDVSVVVLMAAVLLLRPAGLAGRVMA